MNREETIFRGIVLYNIERNKFLNGVYSNNHPATGGRIFTETVRLIDDSLVEGNTLVHIYESLYFDLEDWVNCRLTFRITDGVYRAVWQLPNGNIIFRGEGFLMNDRQIAITYWREEI